MPQLYSPSLNGFLDTRVHTELPDDAIALTESEYNALFKGQTQGKVIAFDTESRRVVLRDPEPLPAEELASAARRRRDDLLRASDWTQLPDVQLSDDARAAWQRYRQALRDISDQPEFPVSVTWPALP